MHTLCSLCASSSSLFAPLACTGREYYRKQCKLSALISTLPQLQSELQVINHRSTYLGPNGPSSITACIRRMRRIFSTRVLFTPNKVAGVIVGMGGHTYT